MRLIRSVRESPPSAISDRTSCNGSGVVRSPDMDASFSLPLRLVAVELADVGGELSQQLQIVLALLLRW